MQLIGGIISAVIAGSAANQQAQAIRDAAEAELEAYSKAQELLEKNKDEAISDIELAQIRSTGLLDEAEIAYIEALNKSEGGAIATLDQWYNSVGEIYASNEELVLRDLVQYGIVEPKKHINKSTEKAIAQIIGDSEKAANLFKPYQEAGRRGLERQQFLTGMLTEEERTKHLDKYGAIEGTPIYEFRLGEGKKALERRQKMSGNIFSGKALEQELDLTNQLSAEETQRQLNEARGLSAQGFAADSNVAGILQNRGQQISGLESQGGVNLAQIDQQGARGLAAARTGFADAQAANTRGLYQNKYNLGLSLNEARAQIRKNTLLNKAQIAREDAQNIANIKIGVGGQVAGLQTQGASNYAQNLINASTVANQGALASAGLLMQGIGQQSSSNSNNQFMDMMKLYYTGGAGGAV